MSIELDIQETIKDLIFIHKIDIDNPAEINRIDNIILKNIQELQLKTFEKTDKLMLLKRYMIKKHYFIT